MSLVNAPPELVISISFIIVLVVGFAFRHAVRAVRAAVAWLNANGFSFHSGRFRAGLKPPRPPKP